MVSENIISEKIKYLRQKNKMTQQELANQLRLSKQSISNYETGYASPPTEVISNLSKIFGVSSDFILGISNDSLPIIGKIPAGTPIMAISSFEGEVYIPAPIFMKYGSDLFALRVHGDSMSKVLHDKAIAIIKKQSTVENGEIAVILVDHQDATLKRFYRLDDETVVLKPDSYSDEYNSEIIDLKKQNIEILGKLIWSCSDEF